MNEEAVNAATAAASPNMSQIFSELEVSGRRIRFQLDTGASSNVIGERDIMAKNATLTRTTKFLRPYYPSKVHPVGTFEIMIKNPRTGECFEAEFVVVKSPGF